MFSYPIDKCVYNNRIERVKGWVNTSKDVIENSRNSENWNEEKKKEEGRSRRWVARNKRGAVRPVRRERFINIHKSH